MRRSAYGNILEISSFASKILLESGAEISRVELTARHICRAYGLEHCECFASPTAIMISVIGKNGEVHSVVRRITKRSVNLRKVEMVNEFSRRIDQDSVEFDVIKAKLIQIDQLPSHPLPFMVLVAAAGTAAFTQVFGGSWQDVLWGFFAGGLVHLIVTWLSSREAGAFLTNLIGGAGCALFAWLFTSLGLGGDWWIVTISALMLLVPGMLMTNAFRDLAAGDFVSGLSRGAEALCIAVSLAGGAAVVIFILQLGGM
jgi:Uncharacterized conserved protein